MTYLLVIALSWYVTKLYYTKTFKLMPKETPNTVNVVCNHCSKQYNTAVENLRAFNYCGSCK